MIELLHILSDSNIGGAGKALLSFLAGFEIEGECKLRFSKDTYHKIFKWPAYPLIQKYHFYKFILRK